MDARWIQWINASLNTYFNASKGPYHMHLEGQQIDVETLDGWAELRINGPDFTEHTKNQWRVNLSVDIMCQAKLANDDKYLIHKIAGQFQQAMLNITTKQYLSPTVDWFCLQRIGEIKTYQWGIVTNKVNVYATSVLANYSGDFTWQ